MASSTSSSNNSYSLQITINSAESLTMGGKKPVRNNLFVTISAQDDYYQNQEFHNNCNQNHGRTSLCKEGHGRFPAWNANIELDVPMHVKFIIFDVRCTTKLGDKSIGVAKVPVSDFIGGSLPRDYLHLLSYRLRDKYGDPNGIINFSVKVMKENYKVFGYNKRGSQIHMNSISGHRGLDNFKGLGSNSYCNEEHNKAKPWDGTTVVGGWSGGGDGGAVVGVPATWYDNTYHVPNHH